MLSSNISAKKGGFYLILLFQSSFDIKSKFCWNSIHKMNKKNKQTLWEYRRNKLRRQNKPNYIKSTFEQLEFWMIYELEIKIYNKLEYFRKSSICARVIFFYSFTTLRSQAWDLQLYLKRDSSTGVFLWILQIFKNTFFYRTPRVVLST